MQNTEKQRDSRKTRSSDDERGPRQTIVRFFTRTHASLMLAAVACALPAQSQQAIVAFAPPGAVSTFVNGISTSGLITGGYTDIYTNNHGFLRTPDGQFTIFEAPAGNNIQPQGIAVTSAGVITGGYWRWAGWDPAFGRCLSPEGGTPTPKIGTHQAAYPVSPSRAATPAAAPSRSPWSNCNCDSVRYSPPGRASSSACVPASTASPSLMT